MVYITGDTHGDFSQLLRFHQVAQPSPNDCMVILGDVGFNYSGGEVDRQRKQLVNDLNFPILCIHGNHECRPIHIEGYQVEDYCGGRVWVQPEFPNLRFAIDGEVYRLNGLDCMAIGGAYSVDKFYRLMRGILWFKDEQPSEEIKAQVEERLAKRNYAVDVILSHTCPIRYEPTEVFLPFIDQSAVDKSTEIWLGTIEEKLHYQKWYCGHYHTQKNINKMQFMFHNIEELIVEEAVK